MSRVTDLVEILKFAAKHDASDVTITCGAPPVFRINGDLIQAKGEPLVPDETKRLIYGILSEPQVARFESEKELDFSFAIEGKRRFRCNVFFQKGSVGAAFRLIPERIPTFADLGLSSVLEEFAMVPQGLILVTGPTGHGKSTTQAAMLDLINKKKRVHIVTIEDPVEFVHRNINSIIEQREVGEDTHSFANALKHVLRQDPDVVLVGEMRDMESVAAALTAAETGHLVISTLHTNDCVQAIDRLIDVFPPHQQSQVRAQLSMALHAVVAQRLLSSARGKGRVVAVEILRNTPAVANLIREGKMHQVYSVMETQAKEGMRTMDAALKELYLRGAISYDDCRQRMRSPLGLDKVGE